MLHKSAPGSPHSRKRKEDGSALAATLLLFLVLTIIVGASMARCLFTWNQIGVSYRHDCALHAAESGIEMTLFALNHRFPEDKIKYGDIGFDQVLKNLAGRGSVEGLTGSLLDPAGQVFGNFTAGIEYDPSTPDRAVITCTGVIPNEEAVASPHVNRTVRVVVHRTTIRPEVFRAAIYAETILGLNGITEVHGNVSVGEDLWSSENIDAYERITQFTYEYWDEATQSVLTATGEVDAGRNLDTDPYNDVILPFDEFILECFKQLSREQGYYFDEAPSKNELPSTFFQPDGVTPNVVFITDTLRITGNARLGGLIFVVGDIYSQPEDAVLGGDVDIDGIIYTTGAFRTLGGGARAVNLTGGAFGRAADLTGNALVEYQWEYFEALKDLVLAVNKYRFFSWQEIIDTPDSVSTVTQLDTTAQPTY